MLFGHGHLQLPQLLKKTPNMCPSHLCILFFFFNISLSLTSDACVSMDNLLVITSLRNMTSHNPKPSIATSASARGGIS